MTFAGGRQAKVNDLKSEVIFVCFSVGTSNKSEKSERFDGDVEQKLGMHARVRKMGHQ